MKNINQQLVQEKNKKFYEVTAAFYEEVDRRRSGEKSHQWLRDILKKIAEQYQYKEKSIFLDAGSGTGFLAQKATDFFSQIIALDISPAMLEKIKTPKIQSLCGSCENIPLDENSVDVVGAFAVLHHLYSPSAFFSEAYRVLKPGGILYTDHDIESHFIKNFSFPLNIYRYFFDHGPKYLAKCPDLSIEDYELSEFHGNIGLNADFLKAELYSLGFQSVSIEFHWQGLLPISLPWERKGFSPLLRIFAIK